MSQQLIADYCVYKISTVDHVELIYMSMHSLFFY